MPRLPGRARARRTCPGDGASPVRDPKAPSTRRGLRAMPAGGRFHALDRVLGRRGRHHRLRAEDGGPLLARILHESRVSPSPGTLWVPSPIEGEGYSSRFPLPNAGEGKGEGAVPTCDATSPILQANDTDNESHLGPGPGGHHCRLRSSVSARAGPRPAGVSVQLLRPGFCAPSAQKPNPTHVGKEHHGFLRVISHAILESCNRGAT